MKAEVNKGMVINWMTAPPAGPIEKPKNLFIKVFMVE
jgi:hypothetical protein